MDKQRDQQLLHKLRTGLSYEIADALAELMGGAAFQMNREQLMGCLSATVAQFVMGRVPREEFMNLAGGAYDVSAASVREMFPERKN